MDCCRYQLKIHDLRIEVMRVDRRQLSDKSDFPPLQFPPNKSQPIYFNNPVIKIGPMYVHRNRHWQDQLLIRQAPVNE